MASTYNYYGIELECELFKNLLIKIKYNLSDEWVDKNHWINNLIKIIYCHVIGDVLLCEVHNIKNLFSLSMWGVKLLHRCLYCNDC